MQFTFYCFFLIFCHFSTIISVPINQNLQQIKHKKAAAIASRLLNELAQEQIVSQPWGNDEKEIKSNLEIQSDEIKNNIKYIPSITNLYPTYDNINDEEPISEIYYVDGDFSMDDQELMDYLDEKSQQQLLNEDLVPVIHAPIIDDNTMKVKIHL